jgi:hypothetical protein
MAKRFTATEIWEEDWFLDMPNEYKLFWFYMKDRCDHAGLFKVNTTTFNKMHDLGINSELAFELFNKGKKRIRKVNGSSWLIEDFFLFQYGEHFNTKNRMHESILKLYNKVEVKLESIRGLVVVCDTLKDKDKDKV